MKTVCIVQARLGSSRFPCKILADLCGRPMLSHVLERAKAIKFVDQVVLAVPSGDAKQLKHLWPDMMAGDEKDVLSRYAAAACFYKADIIVRVTGDCPLLAPNLCSRAVEAFKCSVMKGYLAFCQPYATVADGWDVEVFSMDVLAEAQLKATKTQREHVVTWMRNHCLVHRVPIAQDFTKLKLSVDTKEDLARVKLAMQYLNNSKDFDHEATWEAWHRAGRP